MRLPTRRQRKKPVIDPDEARRELARAQALEKRARAIVEKERRIKERNNFGPKFRAAMREAPR